MSGNMPSKDNAALAWLEGHIEAWSADPASIGLTAAQASELESRIVAARDARIGSDQLHVAAKVATASYHAKAVEMKAYASPLITLIKGFAATSPDPSAVLGAAHITAPAPRQPASPPERPAIANAILTGKGGVTIEFIGRGPTGTSWQVSRKLAHETAFTFVGTADVATKSFTDDSLPAAICSATYSVQGVRGSLSGASSFPMVVKLGAAVMSAAAPAQGQAA